MSAEKSLAVSALMFLVGIKSFEVFTWLQPNVLNTCELAPRFAASLILSTLAVTMIVSLGLCFFYFKKFGSELCENMEFEKFG